MRGGGVAGVPSGEQGARLRGGHAGLHAGDHLAREVDAHAPGLGLGGLRHHQPDAVGEEDREGQHVGLGDGRPPVRGRGGREQGVEDQRAVALGVGVILQPVGLAVASGDVGDGLQPTDACEELDARGGGVVGAAALATCTAVASGIAGGHAHRDHRAAVGVDEVDGAGLAAHGLEEEQLGEAGAPAWVSLRQVGDRLARVAARAGHHLEAQRADAPRVARQRPHRRSGLAEQHLQALLPRRSGLVPRRPEPVALEAAPPLGEQPQGVSALGAGVDAGLEVAPVVLPGDAGSAPEEAHRVGRSHEQPPSFGALATRVPEHSQEATLGAQVGQHRAEVVHLGPEQVDGLQGELSQHQPQQKQSPALEGLLEPRVDQLGLRLLGARVEQELAQQVGHHLGLREGRREALGAQVRVRRLPGALLLVEGEGVGGRGVVGAWDELDHGVSSGGRRAASARSSWRARRRGRAGARAPALRLRSTRTETRR